MQPNGHLMNCSDRLDSDEDGWPRLDGKTVSSAGHHSLGDWQTRDTCALCASVSRAMIRSMSSLTFRPAPFGKDRKVDQKPDDA